MTSPSGQDNKFQRTGHFKEDERKAKDGTQLSEMLKNKRDEQNKIYNKNGMLDARAFKKIIFERQAGSMTGPKNFLAAQVNSANQSEFLEDNILLHGLKSFGITIDELLAANLQNIDPNAYKPLEPRFKTQEEFVENVQKHLQSPVVRSLKSIVDIIRPSGYGISKVTRHRSLPTGRSTKALTGNASTSRGMPSTSVNSNKLLNQRSLETVSEEHGGMEPSTILSQRRISQAMHDQDGGNTTRTNDPSGLQSVPEQIEQENDAAKQSIKGLGLQTKNFSVPRLNFAGGAGGLSRHKMSDMKGSHAQSSHIPLMSQMAIHNRSSTMKDDHSLAQQILGLQEELDQQISQEQTQSDRYVNKTPFRHTQSNYHIAPQSSIMFVIPEPEHLDEHVNQEDYQEVYLNIVRKYQRRDRFGKVITTDPAELNRLSERGYKIKAERYQHKRTFKKQMKKQRSIVTGEVVSVRGEPGYESSSSSSASEHSSVSYGGVPEADLEHMVREDKQDEINKRRNRRRADKWQIIFDSVVSEGVKREISGAVISRQAAYEGSDASPINIPSQAQPLSDDQSDSSPTTKRKRFAESQAQMKDVMDQMANRLKNRFLENIDEEVPEEYLIQKEQESIQNQTDTSFTKGTSFSADPLDQIEQSIQTMMEGLVSDIRANGTLEDQYEAQQVMERQIQTKPSHISNQASYISQRRDLSQRMNKFQRTQNTSPRFYDNHVEDNLWKVKMKNLEYDKIKQIFPNNKRIESLQKLAEHLRSKQLIPSQRAGEVPKGFNNKMPLDKVMQKVGNHMHKRSQDIKQQKPSSHNFSINQTQRLPSDQHDEMNYEMAMGQLNQVSSTVFAKSPSMVSQSGSGLIKTSGGAFQSTTNFSNKRNSDQLMQDVNAVFQFLAQTNGNGSNSLKSLHQALKDQKEELQECIIVEKQKPITTNILSSNSSSKKKNHHAARNNNSSQQELPGSGGKPPPICYCNHMAAHRHFYMNPSQSTRNFLGGSDFQNSMLIASDEKIELGVENHKLQTAQLANQVTSEDVVHPGTSGSYAIKEFQMPGQIHQIAMIHNNASTTTQNPANEPGQQTGSSQGIITPMGFQKPPMTDRNWNNSELKKFSMTQSKSNADIVEDLRRFKEAGGLDSFNNHLQNQNINQGDLLNGQQMNATQIAHDTEDDDDSKLKSTSQFATTGSKKGKTFTVLFKSDRKNEKSQAHLRSNNQLETPGMMREVSKDEYLRPGMVEKARYDEKSKDKQKSKSPLVHKINILQNLNESRENKDFGLSSHNVRISARQQQLLSVSVKNIELPDQYRVADQQKPFNQKISEIATPVSTKAGGLLSKQQKVHEIGLQTAFQQSQTQSQFQQQQNQTHQSFFVANTNQLPIVEQSQAVIVQSQLEKYPAEILASQPTLGTESQDKLHGLNAPTPKYLGTAVSTMKDLTSNSPRREGTRLMIMSENTERSMNIVEEERKNNSNQPAAKQTVELGRLQNLNAASGTSLMSKDAKNQQQPIPVINVLDAFNIKGQQKNLQVRGQTMQQQAASPSNSNLQGKKHEIELGKNGAAGNDEITATQGAMSQFEIPRPIYQQDQLGSQEYETEGTAYGSNRGDRELNNLVGKAAQNQRNVQNMSAMMQAYPRTNLDLKAVVDPKTDRVVRNFKPSKTRKLPEMLRTMEKKLSQLADSNVTPLGLFNQDLHAQREWNKLMAQKNFSATLNDKQMSFKDAMVHDILMPLPAPGEANKTSQNLPAHLAEQTKEEEAFTDDNSIIRPSGPQSKDLNDNSTLQSPESRTGVYKKLYEQPRIQVFNETHQKGNGGGGGNNKHSPRKQQLQTKVPLARQNGKVIVFNFKGNQDLPDEILKRVEVEQQNQALARMPHQGSKPLLLSNSQSRNMLAGSNNSVFSPKRHSSVNPNDSVSIYQQAKAALGQDPALMLPGTTRNGILKGSSTHELIMKEERTRYRTTVRKRINAQSNEQANKQPTSLSTSKFLIGRRNPTINAQMYSQKVSPFKPMGGGFKQNLNIEVSAQRMEQEVSAQRDKMLHNSNTNVFSQPARGSFRHANNTLELTLTENHEPVGFSIEKAVMTQKQAPKADIRDLVAEDVVDLSSKTKEKIGKSALSRLDQQLMDFKANSDGNSSEGPRGSAGITPGLRSNGQSDLHANLRAHNDSSELIKLARDGSKSSTEYHQVSHIIAPTASNTIQNFAVPKMALVPKPVKEMIQTNDSFSKIINESPLKRKSPKLTNNQTRTTFARKKESTGVPYPIKSGIVGENFQNNSSFNQSGNWNQQQNPAQQTKSFLGGRNSGQQFSNSNDRNSPKLEGTRMNLTHKSKNDTRSSPFEKEPESPRKRLSPKTLATIKGGTKENPIKLDQETKLKNVHKANGSGVESRMRTDSRGLSQVNPGSMSRPDLVTQAASLSKDEQHRSLIEREYSQDDILNSGESKNTRQVVGLVKGTIGSDSVYIAGSREDLERTAMTAKQSSKMKMYKLDDIHAKIQNLDNNVRATTHNEEHLSDPALMDNPGELGNLYQMHVDAQRHIESLVKQPPLLPTENPSKHHYIQKVAQMQVGAQNYRRKGKRQKDGLNLGFEFQNNNTQDSLSRVLGRNISKNNRNIMTLNLNPMNESKKESSMIYDSRGTDQLFNSQNKEVALSVNNNNILKKAGKNHRQ